MSRILSVTAVACLMFAAAGCKSEAESAMAEVLDKQKEIVTVLKGVTDKDSAVAAKAKLQGIGAGFADLGKRMEGKKIDAAEKKRLEEKYKPQMEQVNKELKAEMERIVKIPGAAEPVGQAMMALAGDMFKMAGKSGFPK